MEHGIYDKVWQRRVVAELGVPQPAFVAVSGHRVLGSDSDLADFLHARPGSCILKPRYGSNGVGVVRVVSHPDGRLTAESDCPETASFLDDFPAASRDLITAVATQRGRYLDRARAGIPERLLDESILEDEIRRDESDGCVFESRVVMQRAGESFAPLGAMCKVVATPVGACVARGFREVTLSEALAAFLASRGTESIHQASADVLAAGERVGMTFAALLAGAGVRVHQYGVDSRLCWDGERVVPVFLEVQFGIGRIDPTAEGAELSPDYLPPHALRERFGLENG